MDGRAPSNPHRSDGRGPLIRAYESRDDAAITALIIEMQEHERSIDPRLLEGSAMALDYRDDMFAKCDNQDGCVLVAESGGEVVGFVTVLARVPALELDEPPGSYALVSDLSVASAYRSRRIGRALLTAAANHARANGATELRIGVLAGNIAAERLYRSFGFEPHLVFYTLELR